MIVGFRHKGLKLLFETGSSRGVIAAHKPKLLSILAALDVACGPDELALPSYRLHQLKGSLKGHWSISVNGNWRVTFRFAGSDVELVDYQDYH
jgi:toxin HigB-1